MAMTKRAWERFTALSRTCAGMGIDGDDLHALLRIERTLRRWAERECNGEVETDSDGKAWAMRPESSQRAYRTANRERGALKRLAAIMARHPELRAYVQGDPRGCALYVYSEAKLRERCRRNRGDTASEMLRDEIDSSYSSVGVAVCYS